MKKRRDTLKGIMVKGSLFFFIVLLFTGGNVLFDNSNMKMANNNIII